MTVSKCQTIIDLNAKIYQILDTMFVDKFKQKSKQWVSARGTALADIVEDKTSDMTIQLEQTSLNLKSSEKSTSSRALPDTQNRRKFEQEAIWTPTDTLPIA
jgi:hypothetical protein